MESAWTNRGYSPITHAKEATRVMMAIHNNHGFLCPVCGQGRKKDERMHGELIRHAVLELIQKAKPDWKPADGICLTCLDQFRAEYVQDVLETEKGEITQLDQQVIDSLKSQELVAKDLNQQYLKDLTLGDRIADKMAEFGGSWKFLITFAVVMFVWIVGNSIAALMHPFDPFPYILLNLVLSCLASIQAPVIMMSQNRQESKDRLRADGDYKTNLKAELEIRQLHMKLDQLLTHQWQRLLEIQQIQTELMEQVLKATEDKQRPWELSSLADEFYFVPAESPTPARSSWERRVRACPINRQWTRSLE